MNLDDLSDFLLVATYEGFAQASRASGRPKASLSRRVMQLEAALGVRLFERGTRKIALTEEGALLLERTNNPMREIAETAVVLRDGRAQPHGLLRISAPTLFGQLMMGRLAAQFTIAYPEVKLAVTLEDRQVDLVNDGFDLVIRVNPEPNSELVGRCFGRDQVLMVSTAQFKRRFMRPGKTFSRPVPVITRTSSSGDKVWRVVGTSAKEIPTNTVLQLPLFTMIRDAVLTGLGAASLPRLIVDDDLAAGRLVSWGTATDRPSELWALHTSRRLPSAKVKAFMTFLDTEFQSSRRGSLQSRDGGQTNRHPRYHLQRGDRP
ncbi:MAG: LysR family transcriptional regulator [Betaproteobacteria bacterium]